MYGKVKRKFKVTKIKYSLKKCLETISWSLVKFYSTIYFRKSVLKLPQETIIYNLKKLVILKIIFFKTMFICSTKPWENVPIFVFKQC